MSLNFRIPIRYKLLTSSLLVTTAVVSIITFSMANLFHTDKKAYIHDLTSTLAVHAASDTRKLLEGYKERLKLFALFILERNITQESKTELLKNMFQDFQDVIAVSVTYESGKDVTLYDFNALDLAGITEEQMKSMRKNDPLPIKDILAGQDYVENSTIISERPVMTLAIAYTHVKDTPVVVSGVVSMEGLINVVNRSKVFESIILDKYHRIFSNNETRTQATLTTVDWLPDDIKSITSENAMSMTGEYSKQGDEYIGGLAPVGIAGLTVLTQIRKNVAYLTARELFGDLTGISLILLIGSAIFSLFLAYRMTKPLERLLFATNSVGKGDFDINISVESNDEIGELATSFNQMAGGLIEREEKLNKANIALVQSEKMSAFGQLSAGIAHEVKNPLAGILGYAQLSKRKLEKDNPLYQNIDVIEKETKRCRDIIDNLMRFARYDKSEYCEVGLNDVVNDAATIVNHQLSLRNVSVEIQLQDNMPLIMGNPNQLQQVFMNLLINAQQAMGKEGGKIHINSLVNSVDKIEISISDDGPGIPDEIKNNIFEPFFTTKKAGEGTGLGLSVSYGIIQDHNGDIMVEDGKNGGTVFRVIFPTLSSSTREAEQLVG